MMHVRSLKNRRREREMQQRMEAEMNYRRTTRDFDRYLASLENSIAMFRRKAYEAERNGQHEQAVRNVQFVRKLGSMSAKVDGIRMRLEMIHSMQGLSNTLVQFMDSCNEVGSAMKASIDPVKLMSGQANLQNALYRMDELTEQMDGLFGSIDTELTPASSPNDVETEQMLRQIVAECDADAQRERTRDEQRRILLTTGNELNERLRQLSANG